MSNQNYTLDIVSHHPQFAHKTLRKYYVEGIETIGAWGDEPFEIRFKNNTWQKVQVKISVDGTDVLSGKPADTELSKDMWVVNGYATLTIKAWPENNNGGAGFVFTSASNGVATHTHGDMSSRGIIAAAVFVEGHVEPIKYIPPVVIDHHHYHYPEPYYKSSGPIWIYNTTDNTASSNHAHGTRRSRQTLSDSRISGSMDSMTYNSVDVDNVSEINTSASLEKLVAVGAGQHVDQKITYVAGLIKPQFTETVRVKYLWWDDLVEKLRTQSKVTAQPSGFPADKKKNIDLKSTPRIGENAGSFRRSEVQQPVFDRF